MGVDVAKGNGFGEEPVAVVGGWDGLLSTARSKTGSLATVVWEEALAQLEVMQKSEKRMGDLFTVCREDKAASSFVSDSSLFDNIVV